MSGQTVIWSTVNHIATVTLNRPEVLNCANEQLVDELNAAADALRDSTDVKCVVIRGAGRAFCSGIDLTALARGAVGPDKFFRRWEVALRKLETLPCPVVAALHSHCIGGGLQLALACDLRVARDDARIGLTAVREGIVPGLGMWRVARYAGPGRAKQLALAAETIDAATAHAWGLVDYVAAPDTFEQRLEGLCSRLLEMGRTASRLTKTLTNMAFDSSFGEALEVFCEYQQLAVTSEEHQHAMADRRARRRGKLE